MKSIDVKRRQSLTCYVTLSKKPESLTAFDKLDEYYNFDHFQDGENVVKINIVNPKTDKIYFDSTGAEILSIKKTTLKINRPNITLPSFEHLSNTSKIILHRNQSKKGLAYCLPFQDGHFEIFTDERFESLPSYVKAFIINHELGHSKYRNEEKADLYALKRCIEQGYSYRQVIHAINRTLSQSNENQNRIKSMIKNSLKYYSNESS